MRIFVFMHTTAGNGASKTYTKLVIQMKVLYH